VLVAAHKCALRAAGGCPSLLRVVAAHKCGLRTAVGCPLLLRVQAANPPPAASALCPLPAAARFSPDDKFSRHRVTIKKRYGLLLTQQAPIVC
jgi:hypothetical protein